MKNHRSVRHGLHHQAAALLALLLLVIGTTGASAQSYYNMASGDYAENFSDISNTTNWPNGFDGPSSTEWRGLAVNATGSIPSALRITTTTTNFVSSSSGGVQRGSGNIVLLATGSNDNSNSDAIELYLDFTGRTAGNLSYDVATVNNSTGDRVSSLRVYASVDGSNYTELTGTNLPYVATNNVAGSGSVSVALPASFNNSATARLRFYCHNGTGGSTGSRPKISIDNVAVTSSLNPEISMESPLGTELASGGTRSYGTVPTGSDADLVFRVKNSGFSDLNVTAITFGGVDSADFSVVGTSTATIAPSGQQDFTIRFTPGSTGQRSATVTFVNNDSNEGSYLINLAGEGSAGATAPTATTTAATSVGSVGATLNGSVEANNGSAVTDRGFVYSESDNTPTLGEGGVDSVSAGAGGVGTFSSVLASGLVPNTVYYYQAYATNTPGTGYGGVQTFTTLPTAPVVGAASSTTSSGFTANWTAPAAPFGGATYTYSVEVDDNNDFSSPEAAVNGIASASTSQVFSALEASVAYYYRVRVANAAGVSSWSATSGPVTTSARPPFIAGNLVVTQIGDGSTTLGSAAFPVAIREFTPAGAAVQTVPMPVTGSFRLTDSGNSGSHGFLNTNGAYLAVPGYNSALGTAGVASLNTKVTHILGTPAGVDTRIEFPTTGTIPFSSNDLRSVIPVGDNTFYATGSSSGVWYYDGTDFVQISTTVSNNRNVEIFNGDLYFSTGSGTTGIYKVGTGLPTATGTTATLLLASPSPYGFAISPDGLTAYVADDSADANGGGIRKYTYDSGTTTWNLAYVFSSGVTDVGFRGLAVDFTGPDPVIYAVTEESSANRLIKVTDTGSGSAVTTLATAAANYVFRGVDFTPVDAAPGAPEIQLYSNDTSADVANGASIDIGNHPLSVQNFSFALKNTGTTNLTLGTVGVTASTNATVNITAQPSGTVAAAGSGTVTFDVTPNAAGNWSVTLSVATNDADENPTTWTVSGTARTPFQAWSDGINWNGGDSSAGGDPNGDGITNLESYALDLDPVAPSGKRAKVLSGTDTVTAGGPWFTLTYRRSLTATGVQMGVQATSDLATAPTDLTIDGVNVIQEVANPDVDGDGSAELVRIRVKIPAGAGKRFFSLQVAEP